MAALTDDGAVQIVQQKQLDTRGFNESEKQDALVGARRGHGSVGNSNQLRVGTWTNSGWAKRGFVRYLRRQLKRAQAAVEKTSLSSRGWDE